MEQAIARVGEDASVELHFQPFELNPALAAEGEDAIEHLTAKYGMSEQQARDNGEAIRARGAELGFTFDMDRRRHVWNTFDAHRLLHWAGLESQIGRAPSELQSLMRISYAVFCLKKKTKNNHN